MLGILHPIPDLAPNSPLPCQNSYDTPHDWKRDDQMRPLTDKGKKQAEDARRWFLDGIGLKDNKALVTSGARRAAETLQVREGPPHIGWCLQLQSDST